MRKKISAILTVVLLVMLLLATLVSCNQSEKVDYFDYNRDSLNLVGQLVRLMHEWIGNYGWTVVVFTLFLKIVMLPLDIWQRYSSRKSSVKMQRIQPLLENIDKRYGANTQRANEEKQKLYKKQGYSMLSTCLPMILSMVIFFVMFGGLRDYSKYSTIMTFRELSAEYYDALAQEYTADKSSDIYEVYTKAYNSNKATYAENASDKIKELSQYDDLVELFAQVRATKAVTGAYPEASEAANKKAIEAIRIKYNEERQSWLWIRNVWQPDTWETVMPAYDSGANAFTGQGGVNMETFPDGDGATIYNTIRDAILSMEGAGHGAKGAWNGLMILPILSVGLSFLSMWISQRLEKKRRKGEAQPEPTAQNQQQQATNKMMMIMMPLMMAVFGFMYTGAFAIYMVCNYTLSIIATIALRWPVEKMVEKSLAKSDKKESGGKASYMR